MIRRGVVEIAMSVLGRQGSLFTGSRKDEAGPMELVVFKSKGLADRRDIEPPDIRLHPMVPAVGDNFTGRRSPRVGAFLVP